MRDLRGDDSDPDYIPPVQAARPPRAVPPQHPASQGFSLPGFSQHFQGVPGIPFGSQVGSNGMMGECNSWSNTKHSCVQCSCQRQLYVPPHFGSPFSPPVCYLSPCVSGPMPGPMRMHSGPMASTPLGIGNAGWLIWGWLIQTWLIRVINSELITNINHPIGNAPLINNNIIYNIIII